MHVTVNFIGPHASSVTFHEDATIDGEPARAIVVRVAVEDWPTARPVPDAPGANPLRRYEVRVVRRESRGIEGGDGPHSREIEGRTVRL